MKGGGVGGFAMEDSESLPARIAGYGAGNFSKGFPILALYHIAAGVFRAVVKR